MTEGLSGERCHTRLPPPHGQAGLITLSFQMWRQQCLLTASHSEQSASPSVGLLHHTGPQQARRGQPGPPAHGSLPEGNHRRSNMGSRRTFPTAMEVVQIGFSIQMPASSPRGQMEHDKVQLSSSPDGWLTHGSMAAAIGHRLAPTTSRKATYRCHPGPFRHRSATEGGLILTLTKGLPPRCGSHEKIFPLNQANQTL